MSTRPFNTLTFYQPHITHTSPDDYNEIASKSFASKQFFDAGIYSDPIAGVRLYMAWTKISEQAPLAGDGSRGGSGGAKYKAFCFKHSLAEPRMRMFVQQVKKWV
jgi:hypothetical protein